MLRGYPCRLPWVILNLFNNLQCNHSRGRHKKEDNIDFSERLNKKTMLKSGLIADYRNKKFPKKLRCCAGAGGGGGGEGGGGGVDLSTEFTKQPRSQVLSRERKRTLATRLRKTLLQTQTTPLPLLPFQSL